MSTPCPVCSATTNVDMLDVEDVPIYCNVLCESPEDARSVPRGRMRMLCCEGCSLVFNAAFDESLLEYTGRYENALHFSPHFRAYADELARRIVDRFALEGAKIVDIGCGDGSFLAQICELCDGEGLGIDPAHASERSDVGSRVRIVARYFDKQSASEFPVDLIMSRHVLEHIPDPHEFLSGIREAAGDGAAFYIEVPNGLWTLDQLGIWDLIYEHCSYFTPPALAEVLGSAGFNLAGVVETMYGGQFLGAFGRTGPPMSGKSEKTHTAPIVESARAFGERFGEKVTHWRARLDAYAARGERLALWGAGSKGVMFLNLMGQAAEAVECAVDRNPRKQGMHIVGVGTPILAPGELGGHDIAGVLIMNPLYREEISAQLRELGVDAPVIDAS